MAQRFLHDPAAFGVGYPVIGYDSIVFYTADAVYIDSNGYLNTASTSSKILGYSLDNITMSATNSTVAKVCPKYVYAENVEMVYPASTTLTQTMVGEYAVFSSATAGAQTLNASTTSGTVGQFLILGFQLADDGTTYEGIVKAAFKQSDCYASS
jgi:hypothetical protein